MKTPDKAIKLCDGMWEGTFKIINQQLNEVEFLVNESIAIVRFTSKKVRKIP